MQDRVADVLAQRAALDRGAGIALVLSILLHGGIAAVIVYAALHAKPPQRASTLNIQFAKMPAATPAMTKPIQKPAAPKIDDVTPKTEEPKPTPQPEAPKKPENNTAPLPPFGPSTKTGSATPPPTTPRPASPH